MEATHSDLAPALLRVGVFGSLKRVPHGSLAAAVRTISQADADGLESFWLPQAVWSRELAAVDALTTLVAASEAATRIELATAVLPIWFRHPFALAAQSQSIQEVVGNRLTLGLGVGDATVVQERFGMPWRPLSAMAEYLEILTGLVINGAAQVRGRTFSCDTQMDKLGGAQPPGILLAALGEKMLDLAGRLTDGAVLLLAGPKAIRFHVAPRINAAAMASGRPLSRIVCCLPICITEAPEAARRYVGQRYATHASLPAYRAIMRREGVSGPADVALVGTADEILERVQQIADAGATDFVGQVVSPDPSDERRTYEFLCELVGQVRVERPRGPTGASAAGP